MKASEAFDFHRDLIMVDRCLDRIFIRPSSDGRDLSRLEHGVDGRDLSRSEALRGHIATARSPSEGHDLHLTLAMCGTLWSTGSSSDGSYESRLTIVAHDRGSIMARSPLFLLFPDNSMSFSNISRIGMFRTYV